MLNRLQESTALYSCMQVENSQAILSFMIRKQTQLDLSKFMNCKLIWKQNVHVYFYIHCPTLFFSLSFHPTFPFPCRIFPFLFRYFRGFKPYPSQTTQKVSSKNMSSQLLDYPLHHQSLSKILISHPKKLCHKKPEVPEPCVQTKCTQKILNYIFYCVSVWLSTIRA